MLSGEGRWSSLFLGLFHTHDWASCQRVQPLVFGYPPVTLRQPTSVFSVLLNFSLSTPTGPSAEPQHPRPRPCRARCFPRTRARCLQPWEDPGPRDCSWARRTIGVCGPPPQPREPFPAGGPPGWAPAKPHGPPPPVRGARHGLPRAAPALGRAVPGFAATVRGGGTRAASRVLCGQNPPGSPRNPVDGHETRGKWDARTGCFRRLGAATAPPLPASALRVGRARSRKELRGAGRGRGEARSAARGWGVRVSGLSRGGSLRRDAPKPVPRSYGAGRPGRSADGAARAAAEPVGAAASGGGLGPGRLRRVGAAAAARLPPRAAAPAGALCRRECQAGGARVVVAARPSWEDCGPGLWGRQDCAGCPQVRPPPCCGLRAEPLAGGTGAAACLEGRLCWQCPLPP